MTSIAVTKHATERMAQRAISMGDIEIVTNFGTEVEGGYIFRRSDVAALVSELKTRILQIQRLAGQRVVQKNGKLVSAYHATNTKTRQLLKFGEERQMEIGK